MGFALEVGGKSRCTVPRQQDCAKAADLSQRLNPLFLATALNQTGIVDPLVTHAQPIFLGQWSSTMGHRDKHVRIICTEWSAQNGSKQEYWSKNSHNMSHRMISPKVDRRRDTCAVFGAVGSEPACWAYREVGPSAASPTTAVVMW